MFKLYSGSTFSNALLFFCYPTYFDLVGVSFADNIDRNNLHVNIASTIITSSIVEFRQRSHTRSFSWRKPRYMIAKACGNNESSRKTTNSGTLSNKTPLCPEYNLAASTTSHVQYTGSNNELFRLLVNSKSLRFANDNTPTIAA